MLAPDHRPEYSERHQFDSSSRDLIAQLEDGAGEFDRTFAKVGARFGEGLGLFDSLKSGLLALADELAHPDLINARKRLETLAAELPKVETRLGDERAALAVLKDRSEAVGKVFMSLRSRTRLVAILTQRARIERASIRGASKDLEAFTDEVVASSNSARQAIEECFRRHGEVTLLICHAEQVQTEFARRFGSSMSDLACRLTVTLSELGNRQSQSVSTIKELASHSAEVLAAAGNAVMALQGGDSIRQRIEHVIKALELADSPVTGLRPALYNLEAAQLRATADLLKDDCRSIDDSIHLLGNKTDHLVVQLRDFAGSAGSRDATSLVAGLQDDLAAAEALLRTCEEDRRTVDTSMAKLTVFLEGFEKTVDALRKSAINIVFLGTNAGLRASRIGEGGRGLNVIAKELKSAADLVERNASELGDTFARMLEASADLRRQSTTGNSLETFEATVHQSLGTISQSGERMTQLLSRTEREAGRFVAEIASARNAFATLANRGRAIDETATALEELAAAEAESIKDGDQQKIKDVLGERVFPLYSMVAERDLHRAVLARLSLTDKETSTVLTLAPSASNFEEFCDFST